MAVNAALLKQAIEAAKRKAAMENPDSAFRPSPAPQNPDAGFIHQQSQGLPALAAGPARPALTNPAQPQAAPAGAMDAQPLPGPVKQFPSLIRPPGLEDPNMAGPSPEQPESRPTLTRPAQPVEATAQPNYQPIRGEKPRLLRPEEYLGQARETAPRDRNGRWKSFGKMLLSGLGPSMAQAQANARPGHFGAGDFFSGIAGGLGSGAAGAIDPSIDERIEAHRDRVQNEEFQAQEQERQAKQAEIDSKIANTERQRALTEEALRGKPTFRVNSKGQVVAIDGRTNTSRVVIDENGNSLDSQGRYKLEHFLSGDGVTKNPVLVDQVTGEYVPITRDGKPATSGYVQPVDPQTGMTPAQKAGVGLGQDRLDETKRRNKTTEAQGDKRIAISEQRAAAADGSAGGVSPRLQSSIKQLDDARVAYFKSHRSKERNALKEAAENQAAMIQRKFGDQVTVSKDEQGLPRVVLREGGGQSQPSGAKQHTEQELRDFGKKQGWSEEKTAQFIQTAKDKGRFKQ